jgi:CDP-diacylglycerol pyrophosphatase
MLSSNEVHEGIQQKSLFMALVKKVVNKGKHSKKYSLVWVFQKFELPRLNNNFPFMVT